MNKCTLCPNNCGIDRKLNIGACKTHDKLKIAKYYLHAFEEPLISGQNGSGTIFFCGCPLKCVFCQNFEVSRNLRGKEITTVELAGIFQELENKGAHNINLVNPTHYVDKIIEALEIYKPNIPIVYNSHGYEKIETLEKIDKYVDIYLPDLKYFSKEVSLRYSNCKDYFERAIKAVEFMAKKETVIEDGLMKKGVIVRHLVLPQNVEDSKKVMLEFAKFKDNAYLSLMSQYTPMGDIQNFKELQRRITKREYNSVLDYALSLGIENILVQDLQSSKEEYIPIWDY